MLSRPKLTSTYKLLQNITFISKKGRRSKICVYSIPAFCPRLFNLPSILYLLSHMLLVPRTRLKALIKHIYIYKRFKKIIIIFNLKIYSYFLAVVWGKMLYTLSFVNWNKMRNESYTFIKMKNNGHPNICNKEYISKP